ncbi:MAG: type II toxin-antitoxin system Phd/YefM family antitoxin [Terracidiphilus sp.]
MAWQVYDAKARFSEFLDTALKDGPQVVTRRGVETAVLVPIDEWKRLKGEKRESIKDVLLDPNGPHDIYIPPRRKFRLRPVEFE